MLPEPFPVTASQCDAEDRCTCMVQLPEPCSADTVYAELIEARRQLDVVYSHLRGDEVVGIRTRVDELVVRMHVLESSLHNQSISLSMTELSSIQDQVSIMQETLERFTSSQNSTVLDQLHGELAVIQRSLISLGKRNPISVQEELNREIIRLKGRLASCTAIATEHGENQLDFIGDGLPVNHNISKDLCSASQNLSVGAPVAYKFRSGITGMWLKDPLPVSEAVKTKIYEITDHDGTSKVIFAYANLETYERTYPQTGVITSRCAVRNYGQKPLYLGGSLYYFDRYQNANRVKKLDVFNAQSCAANTVASPFTLPYNYDYLGSVYNDADLNFDETGLYVVFPDANGDLSIMRLNPDTLEVEERWDTGKSKGTIANTFMVCGRLYSTDDDDSRHLTGQQWGFDTNTGEEFHYDLNVEGKFGDVQALSYNPRERAIFGWDKNHPVLYHIFF